MAVENGRPASFLSKKMEADENWAVGFQSNRLTPFYGNGATAKIDIFWNTRDERDSFFRALCRRATRPSPNTAPLSLQACSPLEPDWLTKAAGPKLHRWGQS